MYKTTEIASDKISSDNVIHQRLLYPYLVASEQVSGDVLEVGCGFGRGLDALLSKAKHYTGIDKNDALMQHLSEQHPAHKFVSALIPPLPFEDNSFDFVLTFQVIEHIKDDHAFLSEIARVLRPGGKCFLTTPNIKLTLTRNPWHIREYEAHQLEALAKKYFTQVDLKGISGNEKVMKYYQENKMSVRKITRFDIFNLQYRLPRRLLQIPYDMLNRMNRNKLLKGNNELVKNISQKDYCLIENASEAFDLYGVFVK